MEAESTSVSTSVKQRVCHYVCSNYYVALNVLVLMITVNCLCSILNLYYTKRRC